MASSTDLFRPSSMKSNKSGGVEPKMTLKTGLPRWRPAVSSSATLRRWSGGAHAVAVSARASAATDPGTAIECRVVRCRSRREAISAPNG